MAGCSLQSPSPDSDKGISHLELRVPKGPVGFRPSRGSWSAFMTLEAALRVSGSASHRTEGS
jgi:hypothetical protein